MIIKCKMCGGDLNFTEGDTVCECEYCGSKQTIPNVDSEKKTNLFNRANRLRMNSEFDKACAIYEQIVAEFPEEAEAYWGLCLCNYGIEYVDDPATGEKKPTCHRTLPTSIMEDSNFEQACDYADTVARKLYRDEAKAIDRIQKDILSIVANEQPYDVFICYKETAEDGGRTEDSVLAQDIYDALNAKGLKVFFSRITLEDKLGVQYEPYIYAALSSAKVMLAIGTQFEYFDAVWVKNEWSRFLGMMRADKRKTLIPCFKGLDAYDMPKEFKGLQAQDLGKLGWQQDLVRGVEKLCGKGNAEKVSQPAVQQTVVREVVQSNSNVENLMKRVYLFLEDGNYDEAAKYINKVLDVNAEYAPAYVGKVLVKCRLKKEQALSTHRKSIENDTDWKKALRFANAQQKQTYMAYASAINENEAYDTEQTRIAEEQAKIAAEKKAQKDKYDAAVSALNRKNYAYAISRFNELGEFMESKTYLRQSIDAYRKQLVAQQKEKGNPRLADAKEKVDQAQQAVNRAQYNLKETETAKTELEKHIQAVSNEISALNNELGQVHGLFSGGKKRELEGKINTLKGELTGAKQKTQVFETAIQTAKTEMKKVELVLSETKAKQATIEAELKKTELTTLTDDKIISTVRYAVGNSIFMGRYPQTAEGTDLTSVEWLVLENDGHKALVVSKYGLDAMPYNMDYVDITWEECTLRSWLNNDFINKTFTEAEKKSIIKTGVDNSKNQCYSGWNIDGGNNTQDKIFLLSYAEVNKYFNVTDDGGDNIISRVKPTAYASAHGAYTNNDYKTEDGDAAGWWWLRSPGVSRSYAACVRYDGSLSRYYVDYDNACVRPAFWLNLES